MRVQCATDVQDNRGANKRTKSIEREVGSVEVIASSEGSSEEPRSWGPFGPDRQAERPHTPIGVGTVNSA